MRHKVHSKSQYNLTTFEWCFINWCMCIVFLFQVSICHIECKMNDLSFGCPYKNAFDINNWFAVLVTVGSFIEAIWQLITCFFCLKKIILYIAGSWMESLFQIYIGDVYLHLKNNVVSSKIMVLFTTGLYFYLLIIEVIPTSQLVTAYFDIWYHTYMSCIQLSNCLISVLIDWHRHATVKSFFYHGFSVDIFELFTMEYRST